MSSRCSGSKSVVPAARVIVEGQGVGEERLFGGAAGAAAVAAIVRGENRVLGEDGGEGGERGRDVFGVASEIQHGAIILARTRGDDQLRALDGQRDGRFGGVQAGSGIVQQ